LALGQEAALGVVRTAKTMIAAMTEVTARPYRPPWIEPVRCFQQAEGGGRDEAAEVAHRVDQRDHRRGDAGIQIALGDRPEQRRGRLETDAAKQIATKANTGPPVVDMNIPAAAISSAAATQACWCFQRRGRRRRTCR
jgi:hypothetical protein